HLQGSGSSIARVGVSLFTDIFPLLVEGGEDILGEEYFTPDFKRRRSITLYRQWNVADGLDVGRHIIAPHTISTRDAAYQAATFIRKTNRDAIELQLAEIFIGLIAQCAPDTAVKFLQLLRAIGIAQGK